MDNLTPKNFQFESNTRAASLNKGLYVFSPLRDLDFGIMNMLICHRKMERVRLYFIETFPVYRPSSQSLVETGMYILEERMVPAQLQISTLQEAFGNEGLTAIDCSLRTAQEIQEVFDEVRDMSLVKAIEHLYREYPDKQYTNIIVKAFTKALEHARAVLQVTRREIQNARSGKAGKSFIDDRDDLFCALTEITPLSLLSPESQSEKTNLTAALAEFAKTFGIRTPAAPSEQSQELNDILDIMKKQQEQIEKLQARLDRGEQDDDTTD